jgi:hypothetical protein
MIADYLTHVNDRIGVIYLTTWYQAVKGGSPTLGPLYFPR